jgi:hypothetical protein
MEITVICTWHFRWDRINAVFLNSNISCLGIWTIMTFFRTGKPTKLASWWYIEQRLIQRRSIKNWYISNENISNINISKLG